MSMIDDLRVLLQDVVAPDLKAIAARLEVLEKTVDQRFEASEKSNSQRFETIEATMKQGFELVEKPASLRHELVLARIENTLSTLNNNHDAILRAMNMDRRIEQLEVLVASQSKASPKEELAKSA